MEALNTLRSRISGSGPNSTSLMEGEQTPDSSSSSSRDPVQVEPKTYFANERTFIQWISAALLLLTVSSIMLGSGNYNGTSSVIAFSALVLVGYAAFVYFRRINLLRSGEAYGYLDFVGPTILAAGVGIGVFIVFADAVKGSEFLAWGDGDRRLASAVDYFPSASRHLEAVPQVVVPAALEETAEACTRHSLQGINLLEYQPKDISAADNRMVVATPQSLVAHPDSGDALVLTEIPNAELQSIAWMDESRLLALSVGPIHTELLQFQVTDTSAEIMSRHTVQDAPSQVGSMVVLPTQKVLLYLDGAMHTYELPLDAKSATLTRTGSINMKMLNQGQQDDPITGMEHFGDVTYLLRSQTNTLQAWDLQSGATLLDEIALPAIARHDEWTGLALEDVDDETPIASRLRATSGDHWKNLVLHMPLDSYPPQLWTFSLKQDANGSLHMTACDGSSATAN